MKEIGLKLKEKREESGLSLGEVAVDLKVEDDEIKSLEEGIKDNFKDINESIIKYKIKTKKRNI